MNYLVKIALAIIVSSQSFASEFSERLTEPLIKGIQNDLASRMSLPPSSFQVRINNLSVSPEPMKMVAESEIQSVDVIGLDVATARRFEGFASFPILIKTQAGTYEFKAKGVLSVIGPVLTARVNMPRDHITEERDFQVSMMAWGTLPVGIATLLALS